jgi:hypothetical protein
VPPNHELLTIDAVLDLGWVDRELDHYGWVALFAACVKGRRSFTPLWVLLVATSWQKPERCSFSNVRNERDAHQRSRSRERQQQFIEVWPTPRRLVMRQAGALTIQRSAE